MTCGKPRRIAETLIAAALVWAAGAALAEQPTYRWNDANGGVHYGDRPPKDARNLSRVEIDAAAATMPSAPREALPPATSGSVPPKAGQPDLLTQRRATRERLEANLTLAREKLELARKNLAEATDMAPDEQQVVMAKVANAPDGTGTPTDAVDPGRMQLANTSTYGNVARRSNCFVAMGRQTGKSGVICPTIIPNQAYRERMAALEDAVKKAQDDVAAAETAYRRGVD
jgi:hypothetical protein